MAVALTGVVLFALGLTGEANAGDYYEMDLGLVNYSDAPKTWDIDIPAGFTKVEIYTYDGNDPSRTHRCSGWKAYMVLNGKDVWRCLTFDDGKGDWVVYDGVNDKEIWGAEGAGKKSDVTDMVRPGSNTLTFYHYNEGPGIGVKLVIYTGGATEMDLGLVNYSETPKTWNIDIPAGFTKVEIYTYDGNNPSYTHRVQGWNAYMVLNGKDVWRCLTFDDARGDWVVYDGVNDKEIWGAEGAGKKNDVTSMVRPGSNTLTFYHYNEGPGIGVILLIYTK